MIYTATCRMPSLFLMIFLLFESGYSQDAERINRSLQDFASQMRFGSSKPSELNIKVGGSEFLDENFVNGEILTLKSEHFTGIPMRYNAYLDNIEVKLPDSLIYNLSDPGLIFQIRLKNQVLVYSHYISPLGDRSGFLFVLHDGRHSLYRRNYKVFKERVPSNGIINEVPARIVDKPSEYYVKSKDGLIRLFNSKKDLLDLLGEHIGDMEDFIRKNRIRLNHEDDMIKVMAYYNSL